MLRALCLSLIPLILLFAGCGPSDRAINEVGTSAKAKPIDAPIPSQDLEAIVTQLKADGVVKVAQDLQASSHEGDQAFAAVLQQLSLELTENPHQLWFQLQARSRYPGLEKYREWLDKQRPDTTMTSLTALPMIPQGVERSMLTGGRIYNMQRSKDGKTLYVGTSAGLEAIDLETWTSLPKKYEDYQRDPPRMVFSNGKPFAILRDRKVIDLTTMETGVLSKSFAIEERRDSCVIDAGKWMVDPMGTRRVEIICSAPNDSDDVIRIVAKIDEQPTIVHWSREQQKTLVEHPLPKDVEYREISGDKIYGVQGENVLHVYDLKGNPVGQGNATLSRITFLLPDLDSNRVLVGDLAGSINQVDATKLRMTPEPIANEVAYAAPKEIRGPELSQPLWKTQTRDGYRVVDSTNGKIVVDVTWPAALVKEFVKIESVGVDDKFHTLSLWTPKGLVRYNVSSGDFALVTLDPPVSANQLSVKTGLISPDGSRLVFMDIPMRSAPRQLRFYDTSNGKLLGEDVISGHEAASIIKFGEGPTMVALRVPTAGRDKTGESLVIYDLKEGKKTYEVNVGMYANDFHIDDTHGRVFLSPKVIESLTKDELGQNIVKFNWPLIMIDLKTGEQTTLRQQNEMARIIGWTSSGEHLLTLCQGAVHVTSISDPPNDQSYRVYPPKPFGQTKANPLRIRIGNQRFKDVMSKQHEMDMVYVTASP